MTDRFVQNCMDVPGARWLVLGMTIFAVLQVVGLAHILIGTPFDLPADCNSFDDWVNLCR